MDGLAGAILLSGNQRFSLAGNHERRQIAYNGKNNNLRGVKKCPCLKEKTHLFWVLPIIVPLAGLSPNLLQAKALTSPLPTRIVWRSTCATWPPRYPAPRSFHVTCRTMRSSTLLLPGPARLSEVSSTF